MSDADLPLPADNPQAPTLGDWVTRIEYERLRSALSAAERRAETAETALAELVACRDLKDRIAAFEHTDACLHESWEACPQTQMEREYKARKPLAWEAARRALSQQQAPKG